MSKTTYLTDALLNHVYRNIAFTSPTTIYASLLSAVTAKEAGTVTELSYSGYARLAVASGVPATRSGGRAVANTGALIFGTKADAGSVTYIAVGLHDAVSGGNLLDVIYVDGADPEVFTANDVAGDSIVIPGHGLTANQRVRLEAIPGGSTLPAGLAEDTDYFVISVDANTIKLSASAGPGAAVDITVVGRGLLWKVSPVTVNQNDAPQIAVGNLVKIED